MSRRRHAAPRLRVAAADSARLRAILDEIAPPPTPERPRAGVGRRRAGVVAVLVVVVAGVIAWRAGGGAAGWPPRAAALWRWLGEVASRLAAVFAG